MCTVETFRQRCALVFLQEPLGVEACRQLPPATTTIDGGAHATVPVEVEARLAGVAEAAMPLSATNSAASATAGEAAASTPTTRVEERLPEAVAEEHAMAVTDDAAAAVSAATLQGGVKEGEEESNGECDFRHLDSPEAPATSSPKTDTEGSKHARCSPGLKTKLKKQRLIIKRAHKVSLRNVVPWGMKRPWRYWHWINTLTRSRRGKRATM
ncbi:hypothetical protein EJB05_36609, partial [Eragrostis curvula]